MNENPDDLNILRKLQNSPNATQRQIAKDLGLSLGKLNYCLKALRHKGYVKIKNFKKNKNKINYIYVLTPKGLEARVKLTIKFMKRKFIEYDELKKEIKDLNKKSTNYEQIK
jgi:EPS-associated MarR family transcriptional regulator